MDKASYVRKTWYPYTTIHAYTSCILICTYVCIICTYICQTLYIRIYVCMFLYQLKFQAFTSVLKYHTNHNSGKSKPGFWTYNFLWKHGFFFLVGLSGIKIRTHAYKTYTYLFGSAAVGTWEVI